MADEHTLFMSNETKEKLDTNRFKTGTPKLNNLEIPMNFEPNTLKKKSGTVAYHVVREGATRDEWRTAHISTHDGEADFLAK